MWVRRKQPGFTIVELLIVVVVIAILAAITVVAYNGITNRAKASAAQSAASQAAKKIAAYAPVNSDAYPDVLSDVGLNDGSGVSYQYSVDNSASPRTYCVTVTANNISYYVSSAQASAQSGACPGHGVNGVAAVTNYFPNPKPASGNFAGSWDGANTGMVQSNVSATWSKSGQANRLTFPATITSAGSGGPTINVGTPYQPYIGQQYTIAASIRLISGTAGIGGLSIDRNVSGSGVLSVTATGGGGVSSLSTSQTYRVYATFTADAAASNPSNQNLRFYIQINNKSSGVVVEFADIDFYPGVYQPTRQWASGDSPNWVWNGAANNATSTGPPL